MPAKCQDDTVGSGAHVVWESALVGKEVNPLPMILVCRLCDHITSPVTDGARAVMGGAGKLEIGVLTVKSRVHGNDRSLLGAQGFCR